MTPYGFRPFAHRMIGALALLVALFSPMAVMETAYAAPVAQGEPTCDQVTLDSAGYRGSTFILGLVYNDGVSEGQWGYIQPSEYFAAPLQAGTTVVASAVANDGGSAENVITAILQLWNGDTEIGNAGLGVTVPGSASHTFQTSGRLTIAVGYGQLLTWALPDRNATLTIACYSRPALIQMLGTCFADAGAVNGMIGQVNAGAANGFSQLLNRFANRAASSECLYYVRTASRYVLAR